MLEILLMDTYGSKTYPQEFEGHSFETRLCLSLDALLDN